MPTNGMLKCITCGLPAHVGSETGTFRHSTGVAKGSHADPPDSLPDMDTRKRCGRHAPNSSALTAV